MILPLSTFLLPYITRHKAKSNISGAERYSENIVQLIRLSQKVRSAIGLEWAPPNFWNPICMTLFRIIPWSSRHVWKGSAEKITYRLLSSSLTSLFIGPSQLSLIHFTCSWGCVGWSRCYSWWVLTTGECPPVCNVVESIPVVCRVLDEKRLLLDPFPL